VFGWIKRRQIAELKKLLFQNKVAAEGIKPYFQEKNDSLTVARLGAFAAENYRITDIFHESNGKLSAENMRLLLDMNRELRRLFEDAELNWVAYRMKWLFSETGKPRTFDEAFKPLMGWKSI
jgi:hypothetical protein